MRKMLLFTFLLMVSSLISTHAQQSVADSLEKLISTLPDDTFKSNRLNDLVAKLQYLDPAKAAVKVDQSIQLASKINHTLGLATAYRLRGVLYVDRAITDSGKIFYDKSFALVKDSKERLFRRQAGLLTHNYGAIFHQKQQFDSATAYYLRAATIYKEIGEESLYFFPYINLCSIYLYLKDYEKALMYAKEVNVAAAKMNDPGRVVLAVNQEMSVRLLLKQYDSVFGALQSNIVRANSVQNYFGAGKAYNLMAIYYSDARMKYDSAIYFRQKALALMQRLDNQYEIPGLLQDLGYDYKQLGDYTNARTYLKKAINLARQLQLDNVLQYSLSNLVDVEEKLGNVAAAHAYLREYVQVNDSLQAKNNRSQVNEMEAKYQATNKELLIKKLEADKKVQQLSISQKNTLNYILLGSAGMLLLISILSYRNYRQKRRLHQQRINELETEKKLTAAEAVLKGEEQERTRLAKDLHDGLGGMMSGTKYSFETMKQNLVMTPENQQTFDRSMDMLDSSIKEMRRVAHNMMPEALVKFGLDIALQDFCNDIDQTGALHIEYQSIGMENTKLDQTTSIAIYRIVQELISNTMKHAGARNSIVQLSKTDDRITIAVEDDGRGFDSAGPKMTKGIGWTNIM
ncbi:MAG: histidine kinase, partial [Chitinophagaceae bacterium]